MPVIINETEIVVEPPQAPAPSAPPPSPAGTRLTPEEVIRVVQRQQERMARVWAD
jgi:hypothetical protein